MDMRKIFLEEDCFPKIFTDSIEKEYGFLFVNNENKDSYDSNHALLRRIEKDDIDVVLKEITDFYLENNSKPLIYESAFDEGYFKEIKDILAINHFSLIETNHRYFVLVGENSIDRNQKLVVKRVTKWDDKLRSIFVLADEPWEIEVAKKTINNKNSIVFVGYFDDTPVGIIYGHRGDDICRIDYLLVEKNNRKKGVGRSLVSSFVDDVGNISCVYLWPDSDEAERIYIEAGFKFVEEKTHMCAVYMVSEEW